MSKLRPKRKICQGKSQSLDYFANEVPMSLRDWVAVAESPHWYAWPYGPTTKNEQCSPAARMQIFRSKSKKGRRGNLSLKKGCLSGKQGSFSSGQGTFLATRAKNCPKGPLFAHGYEPLIPKTLFGLIQSPKQKNRNDRWAPSNLFKLAKKEIWYPLKLLGVIAKTNKLTWSQRQLIFLPDQTFHSFRATKLIHELYAVQRQRLADVEGLRS